MNDSATPNSSARWLPVGAAVGLVAAVIGVGIFAGVGGSAADSTTTAGAAAPPVATDALEVVETVTPEEQVQTDSTIAPVAKEPIGRTLTDGLAGDDVEMVQNRLGELGFDPGPVDGIYGSLTRQAVWAFEKLVLEVPRSQATGKVTPQMWDRMQDPIAISPRRPMGGANHLEVYLQEQVAIIFHGDVPQMIAHVSTGELDANGDPAYFCDEDATWDTDSNGNPYEEPRTGTACAYAKTPGGVFSVDRMVEGKRVSPLGGMWNPVYFNYGIAIHGAENVPLQPASHGCVRVNKPLGEQLQDLMDFGDRVYVWGHDGEEPESFTEDDMLPSFNSREYDTTTTTSTTTTSTTTTTTVAPATTTATTAAPPQTTTAPATTAPATTAPATTTPPTTTVPAPPPDADPVPSDNDVNTASAPSG